MEPSSEDTLIMDTTCHRKCLAPAVASGYSPGTSVRPFRLIQVVGLMRVVGTSFSFDTQLTFGARCSSPYRTPGKDVIDSPSPSNFKSPFVFSSWPPVCTCFLLCPQFANLQMINCVNKKRTFF